MGRTRKRCQALLAMVGTFAMLSCMLIKVT